MDYKPGDLQKYAQTAYDDMMGHFWDTKENHVIQTHAGRPAKSRSPIWEFATVIYTMITMYDLTGDENIKNKIQAQWDYIQKTYPDNVLIATGRYYNPALDDASWTARLLSNMYQITGDKKALELCRRMVCNSYEHWKDGDVGNGLWYAFKDEVDNRLEEKTIYDCGLVLAGLEYYKATQGTNIEDPELFQDTMKVYRWMENYLRRDKVKTYGNVTVAVTDNLYFNTFYDKKEKMIFEPGSYQNTGVAEDSSSSSLLGNTAMAIIHKNLYDITGDGIYLQKALETANAMASSGYSPDGVLVNDFDAWTNTTFIGQFVKEVLPLPGIDEKWSGLLKNTAVAIMSRARTGEGYYKASWMGSEAFSHLNQYKGYDMTPGVMMPSVCTVHMVIAAGLGDKLGLIH